MNIRTGQQNSTERERGFVTVTTAIVLTLLLMCAALALDIAIWFARANELQRTADAAALAGVVKMPDEAKARISAIDIATKNRVAAGNVTVETIPGAPREIRVSVSDPNVKSFFGRFVTKGIGLTRSSTAEYVPKIELGSRLNAIGTGNLPGWGPGGSEQKLWLAVNGKCTAREDGDRFASAFDGNKKTDGTVWCDDSGAIKNLEYRTESATEPGASNEPSYTYVVDVPCPAALVAGACPSVVNSTIDIWNPFYDNGNFSVPGSPIIDRNTVDPIKNPSEFASAGFDTDFYLRDMEGNPVAPTRQRFGTCTNCSTTADPTTTNDRWHTLFQFSGTGKFRIDVSTVGGANAYGSNAFGLRVYRNGPAPDGPIPCDGGACPTIAGQSSMSVFANSEGAFADFFLAQLSPARYYRGKKIQVQLFDPGENARSIQLLRPNTTLGYQPIPFRYRTWAPALDGYQNDPGIPATLTSELFVDTPVSGLTPAQKAPWWSANPPANPTIFNGRIVSMEIQIPPGYGCVAEKIPCVEESLPEDGWWKIRYTTNSTGKVSDRTTWSVRMFGDPVHLTNN
jgi:hypothetical protein